MPDLTSDQLARLRRDLGALGDEAHFVDAALQDNAARVGGPEYHDAILGLCWRQMHARYALEVDIETFGAQADNSQILGHIERQLAIYEPALRRRLPVPLAALGKAPGESNA